MSDLKVQFILYEHTPFKDRNSIRLVALQPGSADDDIRITLQEVALHQLPEYEALSYAWESQTSECPVICANAKLLITKNCFAALRQLRFEQKERFLWIDSICIDQASLQEREQQVQLMGDVYSRAKRVVIWLGEATELSDFVIDYMEYCHGIRAGTMDESVRVELLKKKEASLITMEKKVVQNGGSWEDILRSVFTRSWFSRLWAVQEFVLSRDAVFRCGSKESNSTILLAELVIYGDAVYHRWDLSVHSKTSPKLQLEDPTEEAGSAYFRHFEALRRELQSGALTTHGSATELLTTTRMQVATYAKDQVFGIYGILQRFQVQLALPSYTTSIEDLYTSVTRAAIKHDKNLDVLLETGHVGSIEVYSKLPSWVPDWNIVSMHGIAWSQTHGLWKVFEAGTNATCDFQFLADHKLRVRGSVIDTIDSRSALNIPGHLDDIQPHSVHLASREAFRVSIAFASTISMAPYQSWETWKMVLRCVLKTGRSLTFYERPSGYAETEENADFNHWLNCLNCLSIRDEEGITEPLFQEQEVARDLRVMECMGIRAGPSMMEQMSFVNTSGLRLFKTSAGYLGKGLPSLQEGDVVLLIAGVAAPMIARPVGDTYRLIGPSFIHGIMHGEKWPKNEKDLVDIVLS